VNETYMKGLNRKLLADFGWLVSWTWWTHQ